MDLKGFSLLKASNFFFLTITRVYGEVRHSSRNRSEVPCCVLLGIFTEASYHRRDSPPHVLFPDVLFRDSILRVPCRFTEASPPLSLALCCRRCTSTTPVCWSGWWWSTRRLAPRPSSRCATPLQLACRTHTTPLACRINLNVVPTRLQLECRTHTVSTCLSCPRNAPSTLSAMPFTCLSLFSVVVCVCVTSADPHGGAARRVRREGGPLA